MTISSIVLFFSRAICDVGPVVEAPKFVAPFWVAGFAASLSLSALNPVAGAVEGFVAGAAVVVAGCEVPVVAGPPNNDVAGFGVVTWGLDTDGPNKDAPVFGEGAAVLDPVSTLACTLLPKRPPDGGAVEAGAGVAPMAAAALDAGGAPDVGAVAGLAPNIELGADVCGADEA